MISMLQCFLVAAVVQNIVLSTGMGVSSVLKIMKRPRTFFQFSKLVLGFSVLLTMLFYPIDRALPVTWPVLMVRPTIIVLLSVLLYLLSILILPRLFPNWYRRIRGILPLAALNNLVVGVTLVINFQVSFTFWGALGLAAGSAVGFLLICAITAEGFSRLDNPDIPAAFRGLPSTLLYLGLLALAIMGFNPVITLI